MQGVTCDACCLQGGVNLAQWLVNEPDVAEDELQSYSKGFVKFWRDQRAEYWKEVAQAEKEFDEQQGSSKGLDVSTSFLARAYKCMHCIHDCAIVEAHLCADPLHITQNPKCCEGAWF